MKLFISLLIIIQILGCSDFDNFYKEKRTGSRNLTRSSMVVAKIGRELITKEDLIKSLEGLPPNLRINYLSSPEKLREHLDSYLNQMALYKEAEKMGIDKRENIKESIQNYEKQVLIQALSQDILDQPISEEEINKYYEENPKSFEQLRVSEIFIKVNPEQGISKDEASTIARLVVNRAHAGEDFEELVEYFSDEITSKKKGGDYGYISRGTLPNDVENKIFNLNVGDISDPIETENGFLIIKVTESVKILPLDQVKGKILAELRNKRFSDYSKKLQAQIGVEIFEDNLKKISENGF